MVWNDSVRAALLQFVQSIFPVLQLSGVVNFTSDEVAAIMLAVGSCLNFAGLIFKKGQQPGTAIIAASGSETAPTPRQL